MKKHFADCPPIDDRTNANFDSMSLIHRQIIVPSQIDAFDTNIILFPFCIWHLRTENNNELHEKPHIISMEKCHQSKCRPSDTIFKTVISGANTPSKTGLSHLGVLKNKPVCRTNRSSL